jgi:hypothetical protein
MDKRRAIKFHQMMKERHPGGYLLSDLIDFLREQFPGQAFDDTELRLMSTEVYVRMLHLDGMSLLEAYETATTQLRELKVKKG